jgi:hypothetical protein
MRRLLFVVLGIVPLLVMTAGPARAATPKASHTFSMLVTLYGFPDNSPPGTAIAFPQIHPGAAGVGTLQDPVTFATDQKELKPGTRVYYPFLQKYFVMEDDCAECDQDWEGHGLNGGPRFRHIDLWAGGDARSGQSELNCEDALTQSSAKVIVNPPGNLRVDTTPIWNEDTQTCQTPH